jgi:hypothetical protein
MSRDASMPFDEGMGSSEVAGAQDRIREAGSKIKDRATQMSSAAANAMDRQRVHAADLIDRAASTVHSGVDSAANLGKGLESGMKSTASYIRDHGFKDMGGDLMGVCRRHPAEAVISAAVLGFLLGQVIRRRH